MRRLNLDSVVNAAVIVTCMAVTYAVAERFVVPRLVDTTSSPGYRAGETLTGGLSQLPLASSQLTALLIVSSHCHFCTDSAGFYRRLLDARPHAADSAFQVIVLGAAGVEDGQAFTAAHRLLPDRVLALPRDGWSKLSGTPAILLVDSHARVVGSWTGQLVSGAEREVLAAIATPRADTRSNPARKGGV